MSISRIALPFPPTRPAHRITRPASPAMRFGSDPAPDASNPADPPVKITMLTFPPHAPAGPLTIHIPKGYRPFLQPGKLPAHRIEHHLKALRGWLNASHGETRGVIEEKLAERFGRQHLTVPEAALDQSLRVIAQLMTLFDPAVPAEIRQKAMPSEDAMKAFFNLRSPECFAQRLLSADLGDNEKRDRLAGYLGLYSKDTFLDRKGLPTLFDRLAETYASDANTLKSLEFYRRTFGIDPDDPGSVSAQEIQDIFKDNITMRERWTYVRAAMSLTGNPPESALGRKVMALMQDGLTVSEQLQMKKIDPYDLTGRQSQVIRHLRTLSGQRSPNPVWEKFVDFSQPVVRVGKTMGAYTWKALCVFGTWWKDESAFRRRGLVGANIYADASSEWAKKERREKTGEPEQLSAIAQALQNARFALVDIALTAMEEDAARHHAEEVARQGPNAPATYAKSSVRYVKTHPRPSIFFNMDDRLD